MEKLTEETRRLSKQIEEKHNELRAKGKLGGNSGKITQDQLKRYGAEVKGKLEKYKIMRKEQDALRSELVVLQRTEQILKSRNKVTQLPTIFREHFSRFYLLLVLYPLI